MDSYTIDDIESAVRDWYAAKGLSIPPADRPWLRAFREEAAAASGKLWTGPLPDLPSAPSASDKLVYGTPAYWKNFWAKKHAKKKAAEATAALPPSPPAAAAGGGGE